MTYIGACSGDKAQPQTDANGNTVYYVQAANDIGASGSVGNIMSGQTWDQVASGEIGLMPNSTSTIPVESTDDTVCFGHVVDGGSVGIVDTNDNTKVLAVMDGTFDVANSGCDFDSDPNCVPQVTLVKYGSSFALSDTEIALIFGGVILVGGIVVALIIMKR